ncbi:MAG: SpoIID/LytB domain-containing protein, partial [Oscillospiraceae bacterium]|nr:SpoIID/LytB domain-containing protein [Oscillospiraceae bacterium]
MKRRRSSEKPDRNDRLPLRWTALACCAAVAAAAAVPAALGMMSGGGAAGREPQGYGPARTPRPAAESAPPPAAYERAEDTLWGWDGEMESGPGDRTRWVTVLLGDRLHWMRLNYYLYGVVAAEMPASFPEEALKGQGGAGRAETLSK